MRTLKDEIVELIRLEGPIPVDRYMALCLGHPRLGYYTTRDPFGAAGDFTTAPEISQIFGELIGLWAGSAWLAMGSPARFGLVEIGPGRGTLMSDALRALGRALPQAVAALDVRLVETSPVLRARQEATLARADIPMAWHEEVGPALEGPVVVVGNELLDALPVIQQVETPSGLRTRMVGLDADGQLAFGLEGEAGSEPAGALGRIVETPLAADLLVARIAQHLATKGGAALFIDYGSDRPGSGDTLQAVRGHAFVDPLADPGEADLTTQVQFLRVAEAARIAGAHIHGIVTQRDFLIAMGIAQRAEALRRNANTTQAAAIDAAVARLTEDAERGMGRLFKAIAFSHPAITALPGFVSG